MYTLFNTLCQVLKLLPFQGATDPTRDTQGAASLALGYGLHWAFIDTSSASAQQFKQA